MPKFIITHGSILRGKSPDGKPQPPLGIGDSVEMTLEERNHLDPTGMQFVTPEVFEQMKKSADAHKAIEEAAKKEADNPKAKPSTVPVKTLRALAELKGTTTATPAPAPAKGGGK